jgi:hypothetical protein
MSDEGVVVVLLVAGSIIVNLLPHEIQFCLQVLFVVAAIVAPLVYAFFRFMDWWETREIVRYRIAKRRITARTDRAIAKLERGL